MTIWGFGEMILKDSGAGAVQVWYRGTFLSQSNLCITCALKIPNLEFTLQSGLLSLLPHRLYNPIYCNINSLRNSNSCVCFVSSPWFSEVPGKNILLNYITPVGFDTFYELTIQWINYPANPLSQLGFRYLISCHTGGHSDFCNAEASHFPIAMTSPRDGIMRESTSSRIFSARGWSADVARYVAAPWLTRSSFPRILYRRWLGRCPS